MIWHPDAVRRVYVANGGSFIGDGPPILVLHTTETMNVPGYGGWKSPTASVPHFTTFGDQLIQHLPINVAARALRNVRGGVETNRRGRVTVQVEMVGYARDPKTFSPPVRSLVDWLVREVGLDPTTHVLFDGGAAYGLAGTVRMSPGGWLRASGIVGHQHAPENLHYDPGKLDLSTLIGEMRRRSMMDTDVGRMGDPPTAYSREIGVLQQMLADRGFPPGAIDGIGGETTRKALGAWKASVGISVAASAGEGRIGVYELAALLRPVVATGSIDTEARVAAAQALDSAQRANATLDKIRGE